MSNSSQNLETHTESPANIKDDAPATSSTKAGSGYEATETPQTVVVKVARNEKGDPLPISGPAIPRPTKTVDCNMMSYADDDGVTHQIYMPKGTARLAGALFTAKRFSDLAKFPAWGE